MSYTKLTDFASKDALLTGNPSKLVRGTELGAEFDAIETADALNIKPDTVTAATGKTTPVDADLLTLFDSASTFSLKKLTWANLKATIKTYFDTLYVLPGDNTTLTSLGNNTSTVYTTAGTSTAYTITPTPAISAYAIGQSFVVNFNATCGASPTLQISGIATPPNLVKENPDGTFSNLVASDVPINHRSRVTLISTTQALVERTSAGIVASGAAPVFGARAFCTWNGATTGTYSPTLPSGNISSIVRNGAGDYTFNFSTSLVDGEYAVVLGGNGAPTMGIAQSLYPAMGVLSQTSSAVRVQFYSYAGSTNTPTGLDVTRGHIAIYR